MKHKLIPLLLLACAGYMELANAAIVLDRTRIIYPGGAKSISVNVINENKVLPYLAQSWLEDHKQQKISSPLVVLPPLQRVDPLQKSVVRIAAVHGIEGLPADRESLFYFNIREIPPKTDKSNVMQIAVQTRIKLFYRPESIVPERGAIWQDQVTFKKTATGMVANNPTPYYIIFSGFAHLKGKEKLVPFKDFNAITLLPKSTQRFSLGEAVPGEFIAAYINDYGGHIALGFKCNDGGLCKARIENK
jgi:chaperone protein PapD